MTKSRMLGVALIATLFVVIAVAFLFRGTIGIWLFERAAERNTTRNTLDGLEEGLHIGLCGTGSPLPNVHRAGPCTVIIAGEQVYVVDAGEGASRNLNLMGISPAEIEGVLLTHFHSDHIDGLGPLMLFHWTRGASTSPLPVYGPVGIERVIAGFNMAYAKDNGYRIAHHGEKVVPSGGGGAEAKPFDIAGESMVVIQKDGLTVTAFKVDHDPVKPAVGFRFDYKGRSACISGDTAKSVNLEKVCKGADILVHDALQTRLVGRMEAALKRQGNENAAAIMADITDYHASPEQAAESAENAEVDELVLTHLVPPMPSSFLYAAFIGEAPRLFSGQIVVGEDGMLFSLPSGSSAIERENVLR